MVFLEDPPPEVRDRWQAGADFCAGHGVEASRVTVWRFYRAHVVEWRSEQVPAPPDEVAEKSTAKLLEQARYLLARRAVESLNHPDLPPQVLVGLIYNENRRQELQLARDKFDDELEVRGEESLQHYCKETFEEARERAMFPVQLKNYREIFEAFIQESVASKRAWAAASGSSSANEIADPSPASSDTTP